MDASTVRAATPIRPRNPRALIGLVILALWMGWAAPALWYQSAASPDSLCVAPADRR